VIVPIVVPPLASEVDLGAMHGKTTGKLLVPTYKLIDKFSKNGESMYEGGNYFGDKEGQGEPKDFQGVG